MHTPSPLSVIVVSASKLDHRVDRTRKTGANVKSCVKSQSAILSQLNVNSDRSRVLRPFLRSSCIGRITLNIISSSCAVDRSHYVTNWGQVGNCLKLKQLVHEVRGKLPLRMTTTRKVYRGSGVKLQAV